MKRTHTLSLAEEAVINNKGTEPPYTGVFDSHFQKGIYVCKKCDAPLYLSEDKFSSSCGWPSFDDEIPGSIDHLLDRDGERTEIVCHRCQGHLGHLFLGERWTAKNTRHCVNSISLRFIPATTQEGYALAYLAGGCFWGIEYLIKQLKGVIQTAAGFMGGNVVSPTYREVCTGLTQHAETVEVVFDPQIIPFEELCRYFLEIHDPTTLNRQGADSGTQYRSAIFFLTQEQKKTAENCLKFLKIKGLKITTEVAPASLFYRAESGHQDYIAKTAAACHHHRVKRF